MRPQISQLIRPTLYPELEDAPNVLDYPSVRGMKQPVFFFSHSHGEDGNSKEHSSKSNSWEAQLVADTAVHLLRNGYSGHQIAILTP